MEATISYLLMLQKYINSRQKKDSEIKDYTLCLGNISKDFTINMKKTGLKKSVKFFSVDFNLIDTNDNLDIYRYLMKLRKYLLDY